MPTTRAEPARAEGAAVDAPVVSVVLTTWRTPAPLLAAAIDSILEQTLRELELIIIVDGDVSDAEAAVIADAQRDRRTRVFSPGRVGRGRALNLGIQRARSEIIAIQDADDESHVERLEHQVRTFEEHPEVDLLATSVVVTRDTGRHVDWSTGPGTPELRILDRALVLRNLLVHSSVAVRTDVLRRVGGYAVGRRRNFDYDLYLRVRAVGGVIGVLDEPLLLRRYHDKQGFETDSAIVQRVWATYRLQMVHAWAEPWPRRLLMGGVVTVRQSGHVLRALARRRARSRDAGPVDEG